MDVSGCEIAKLVLMPLPFKKQGLDRQSYGLYSEASHLEDSAGLSSVQHCGTYLLKESLVTIYKVDSALPV